MSHDLDALRQMNEEAQLRISELSTALADITEQRDTLKAQIGQLTATIERLRLHIAQGVEL